MLSARNLPPRPTSISALSTLRDSYCNVSFGGARQVREVLIRALPCSDLGLLLALSPRPTQVTPVVKQSQSPAWNFSAAFPLDTSQHLPQRGGGEEGAAASLDGGATGTVSSSDGPGGRGVPPPFLSMPELPFTALLVASGSPLSSKLRPPPLLLRIDMKDQDLLPPDNDLG